MLCSAAHGLIRPGQTQATHPLVLLWHHSFRHYDDSEEGNRVSGKSHDSDYGYSTLAGGHSLDPLGPPPPASLFGVLLPASVASMEKILRAKNSLESRSLPMILVCVWVRASRGKTKGGKKGRGETQICSSRPTLFHFGMAGP